jgi:D-beta-D-heptose 7-phosphate kinase/D-beta-D-heptose 1-phosphate adenosyltransferase
MLDFVRDPVLCLGDVMLDRFLYGSIERISPEAPVPVVRLAERRAMLGGVGNVARNIASLGGQAVLLGAVGEDAAGRELAALVADTPGLVDACLRLPGRPTTCKTRVIAGHQHVLRLDEEVIGPILPGTAAELLALAGSWLPRCRALVISDYAKGLLVQEVVTGAIDAARRLGLPVLVDPKREDFAFYRGATLLTPNAKELRAAARRPVETGAELAEATAALIEEAEAEAILVTRSEKGMLLVERGGAVHAVPARAQEVFDVSGAGDTVIAVAALAIASGHTLPQAMRLANAAAGVVVGKLGTATVDREELTAALDWDEAAAAAGTDGGRILPLARAAVRLSAWRGRGLRIGLLPVGPGFIPLGRAGLTLLRQAREGCDRLAVALEQASPGAEDAAAVLAELAPVDLVLELLPGEASPLAESIRRLRPDLLFTTLAAPAAPEALVALRNQGGEEVVLG